MARLVGERSSTPRTYRKTSLPIVVLRHAMKQEALTWRELARRAGLALDGLQVEVSKGCPYRLTRWRIERGLNYRWAIWSNPQTLERRGRCQILFECDPFTASQAELRRLASRHGWNFSGLRTKADYVKAVLLHADSIAPRPPVSQEKQSTNKHV
jgi:hypothetical protein